jgi:Na+-driven multidrug efflux pump
VGGGSVLSRALGANKKRESTTFANQIMMTSSLASVFALLGIFSAVPLLLRQRCHHETENEFFFLSYFQCLLVIVHDGKQYHKSRRQNIL